MITKMKKVFNKDAAGLKQAGKILSREEILEMFFKKDEHESKEIMDETGFMAKILNSRIEKA